MASLLNMSGGSLLNKGLPYDAEIEYLESTGTQYINTGIIANFTTIFIINGRYTITGQSGGSSGCIGNERFYAGVYQQHFHFGVGSNWINTEMQDSVRHTFEINGNGTAKLDDSSFTVTAQNVIIPSYSLYLFSTNAADTTVVNREKGLEIYYSKIYENGEIVRDFVPVRVGQVGYMYDKVSKQLFGNAGTGDFILGPDK